MRAMRVAPSFRSSMYDGLNPTQARALLNLERKVGSRSRLPYPERQIHIEKYTAKYFLPWEFWTHE